ncbi:37630_t:CDS:2, partial [Gigaspora margarita]
NEDYEIEDPETEEEIEHNLGIIAQFDIENLVFLNNKNFQDNELDKFDKVEHDELMTSNTIEQSVFDIDASELVANLVKE